MQSQLTHPYFHMHGREPKILEEHNSVHNIEQLLSTSRNYTVLKSSTSTSSFVHDILHIFIWDYRNVF